MARIPEEELVQLKREVALLELVRAAGIELKRHGPTGWAAAPSTRTGRRAW